MISYGGVYLQIPGPEEAAFIGNNIPIQEAFGFARAKQLGRCSPRADLNWFLSRPLKLNCFYNPWGATRWGYAFTIADENMMAAMKEQVYAGGGYVPLPYVQDDDLGGFIRTPLWMLAPVPLSKILGVVPQLPIFLVPLVDERFFWWEAAAEIFVEEGVTTWADLYALIGLALDTAIATDPIPPAYLFPGLGFSMSYDYLPILLDAVAAAVGQRIVRQRDGTIQALNPQTARSLMIAQAAAYGKYAGGSLDLGILDA